jgi:glycine cleavage system aminomethyltransferase T
VNFIEIESEPKLHADPQVSFTGELGYEIYAPMEYQHSLYADLVAEGARFGLRHAGSRALASLRVEKGFPS